MSRRVPGACDEAILCRRSPLPRTRGAISPRRTTETGSADPWLASPAVSVAEAESAWRNAPHAGPEVALPVRTGSTPTFGPVLPRDDDRAGRPATAPPAVPATDRPLIAATRRVDPPPDGVVAAGRPRDDRPDRGPRRLPGPRPSPRRRADGEAGRTLAR